MMPFEMIRNNIAEVEADAIVNTANPQPIIGAGTDAAIHEKAGPGLLEARKKIGNIAVGQCALSPAFDLNAKWVIHAVGPLWKGGTEDEGLLLRQCFENALHMAADLGCSSIAFPMISTGNYGFPKKKALDIALQAINRFLMDHEMLIYLVVWDKESFHLSRSLFLNVQSYIDEHYIDLHNRHQRDLFSRLSCHRQDRDIPLSNLQRSNRLGEPNLLSCGRPNLANMDSDCASPDDIPCLNTVCPDTGTSSLPSLDDLLMNTDASFTETLLKLIDQTGKKDSEIYKKANVSKQHFSKIRNNPDYKPTKATALAFAIALELDLSQTEDLIRRAGYALTRSSKFDVIIMYFISRRNYDMFEINMTLFEFDQMTLGV